MTFHGLLSDWTWVPIRNCPGRFRLAGVRPDLTPKEILGADVPFSEYRVEAAKDTVVVARFSGGGLISYKRANGTYLHTLNTPEGFARKLLQLGISLAGPGGTC